MSFPRVKSLPFKKCPIKEYTESRFSDLFGQGGCSGSWARQRFEEARKYCRSGRREGREEGRREEPRAIGEATYPPLHKTNTCRKNVWGNLFGERRKINLMNYFPDICQVLGGNQVGANTCRACLCTRPHTAKKPGKLLMVPCQGRAWRELLPVTDIFNPSGSIITLGGDMDWWRTESPHSLKQE